MGKIYLWLYSAAAKTWSKISGSTIGRTVIDAILIKLSYDALSRLFAENPQLETDLLADEHLSLIGSNASRSKVMGFLQSVIADHYYSPSTDQDRRRHTLITAAFISTLSTSSSGLTEEVTSMIDEMVESERQNLESSFSDDSDSVGQIEEALTTYKNICTRLVQFVQYIGADLTTLGDFETATELFALLLSATFNHPLYTEFRDGELAGKTNIALTNSIASFFTVLADLRESSDNQVKLNIGSIQSAFSRMCDAGHSRDPYSTDGKQVYSYEWKMFLAENFYRCLKSYFSNLSNIRS